MNLLKINCLSNIIRYEAAIDHIMRTDLYSTLIGL